MARLAEDAYCRHTALRDELHTLFPYKLFNLAVEVIGVVLTPWNLLFYIPTRAPQICQFFQDNGVDTDAMGHVCRLALFEPHYLRNAEQDEAAEQQRDARSANKTHSPSPTGGQRFFAADSQGGGGDDDGETKQGGGRLRVKLKHSVVQFDDQPGWRAFYW